MRRFYLPKSQHWPSLVAHFHAERQHWLVSARTRRHDIHLWRNCNTTKNANEVYRIGTQELTMFLYCNWNETMCGRQINVLQSLSFLGFTNNDAWSCNGRVEMARWLKFHTKQRPFDYYGTSDEPCRRFLLFRISEGSSRRQGMYFSWPQGTFDEFVDSAVTRHAVDQVTCGSWEPEIMTAFTVDNCCGNAGVRWANWCTKL